MSAHCSRKRASSSNIDCGSRHLREAQDGAGHRWLRSGCGSQGVWCWLQPPISVHGSAGRYASALFSAASKAKGLEKTQKELREVPTPHPPSPPPTQFAKRKASQV